MRILYIANQRLPTEKAYGLQIAKMCEAFADRGAKVTLLIPTRKNPITENIFDYYGVKRIFEVKKIYSLDFYLPGKLDRISFWIKNLISAIVLLLHSSRAFDLIYSRDELPVYLLSFFRKNIVFEAHKFSGSKNLLYNRFKKINLKIIAISNGLKNEFIKSGFRDDNLLIAPDGVDTAEFDIKISTAEARKKSDLPPDKKIVMYAGHLFRWKGVDTLARAANFLKDVLFVFVGGTVYDIEKFRNKFANRSNIILMGQKPHQEIPIFLKAADILILPNSAKEAISVSYTSPLKLFEYMASGRPIIASDLPSIREILNERNAYLVSPGNAEKLAEMVKTVLNNPEEASKRVADAFLDVQNYTWHKRAENIIHFLKNTTHA